MMYIVSKGGKGLKPTKPPHCLRHYGGIHSSHDLTFDGNDIFPEDD